MKKYRPYLTTAVGALLFLAGCATMPKITKVTPNDAPVDPNHLYYWLPKTELMADLPIKRTTQFVPTILAKAQHTPEKPEPKDYIKYLGEQLKDFDPTTVPLTKTTVYELVDREVALTSGGVEDPDARFEAELQAHWYDKLKLSMEFSPRMVMQKGEIEVTNQALPIVVSVLKAGVDAGKLFSTEVFMGNHPAGTPAKVPDKEWKKKVDAAIVEMNRVKADRKDILGGSVSFADVAQMQLALGALEREEADLTKALFGSSEEKTWVATCRFAPAKGQLSTLVGKLHEAGGFEPDGAKIVNQAVSPFAYEDKVTEFKSWRHPKSLDKDFDSAGSNDSERDWLSTPEEVFSIEVGCEVLPPTGNAQPGKESLQPTAGSYVYRVPQKARAFVRTRKGNAAAADVIQQTEMMVAQLGELRQLPRSFGTATGSYTIALDGDTGALLKITANADPGDLSGTVEKLGGIVKARQDAKKTAQDAADAAAGESTPEKKRAAERADLENVKAIRDLKAQLGLTDSSGAPN